MKPKSDVDCKFYLGLLSSTLLGKFIKSRNINLDRNVFPKINTKTLEDVPVPDFEKVEKNVRLEVIQLVDQLLQLNMEFQEIKLESRREQIQGKIDYCEGRINEIVYELYELTPEEIKIVEGK